MPSGELWEIELACPQGREFPHSLEGHREFACPGRNDLQRKWVRVNEMKIVPRVWLSFACEVSGLLLHLFCPASVGSQPVGCLSLPTLQGDAHCIPCGPQSFSLMGPLLYLWFCCDLRIILWQPQPTSHSHALGFLLRQWRDTLLWQSSAISGSPLCQLLCRCTGLTPDLQRGGLSQALPRAWRRASVSLTKCLADAHPTCELQDRQHYLLNCEWLWTFDEQFKHKISH